MEHARARVVPKDADAIDSIAATQQEELGKEKGNWWELRRFRERKTRSETLLARPAVRRRSHAVGERLMNGGQAMISWRRAIPA
jgi:hypothetical protein